MLSIRKSLLKRIGLASVVAALAIVAVASVASASPSAMITSPSLGNVEVYFDTNGNGAQEPAEFVGTFPSYPASGITFRWDAYHFPAGVSGSYRVALLQNLNPLGEPSWVERKIAHHFADNPSGTTFDMGPFFDYENICQMCPSRVVVQPETYVKSGDDFIYTPLAAALTTGAPASLIQSDEFVLSDLPGRENDRPGGRHGPGPTPTPGGPTCSSPNDSAACCAELMPDGVWCGEVCSPGGC